MRPFGKYATSFSIRAVAHIRAVACILGQRPHAEQVAEHKRGKGREIAKCGVRQNMSDKQRWPAAIARKVADELVEALTPRCEQICIAGSLRRGKPDVGDIEILYIRPLAKQILTI